ncbi:MAG: HlyD family efflux transporter periplasmic adaptor subunit [Pseudomonadota bacterium]
MYFRDQNIRYFSTLDSIRVPNIMRAVALLIVLAITIAGAFLVFTPWVQSAPGTGTVTALNPDDRLQDITALVSGRINKWYVRDGSRVEKGDPIVEIVDNDPNLIQRLDAERAQLVAARDAVANAYKTAKIDLNRTLELFNEGLAARRDYEQAQIRVENMRGQLAEANASINRIDVTISRQSVQLVKAPRDGVILQLNAGDSATFVSTGQRLATFVPTGVPRAVELYIDGRDVALVEPGSPVRLEFEGWPAFQFSGWPEMAIGTFGGRVAAIDLSAGVDGRFRVLVVEGKTPEETWPDERFVRLGGSARGWVLFDTVPVGYEIWRQLNNFPPQFNASPSDISGQTAANSAAQSSAGR